MWLASVKEKGSFACSLLVYVVHVIWMHPTIDSITQDLAYVMGSYAMHFQHLFATPLSK